MVFVHIIIIIIIIIIIMDDNSPFGIKSDKWENNNSYNEYTNIRSLRFGFVWLCLMRSMRLDYIPFISFDFVWYVHHDLSSLTFLSFDLDFDLVYVTFLMIDIIDWLINDTIRFSVHVADYLINQVHKNLLFYYSTNILKKEYSFFPIS